MFLREKFMRIGYLKENWITWKLLCSFWRRSKHVGVDNWSGNSLLNYWVDFSKFSRSLTSYKESHSASFTFLFFSQVSSWRDPASFIWNLDANNCLFLTVSLSLSKLTIGIMKWSTRLWLLQPILWFIFRILGCYYLDRYRERFPFSLCSVMFKQACE